MFRPTPRVLAALANLADHLDESGADGADGVRLRMAEAVRARRPDLTDALLFGARAATAAGLAPGQELTAALARAACARLGERYPGATIEVRVPPFAAVQIGFEDGSRHTRGTPPNVVEMDPETFLALTTGATTWAASAARVRASGVHASEAARAFPL